MSSKLSLILRILFTCVLFILVFYQVGLFSQDGRRDFLELVSRANGFWLVASIAAGVLVNLSSALKWFMLAKVRALGAGYWRIFSYYLIGQFYNLVLPTSVGGDVVRAYELGKFSGRQADALASVFVERYTGVLMLLILSGLAFLNQLTIFSVDLVIFSLLLFTFGLGFIAWMIFDPRLYDAVKSFMTARLAFTTSLFQKLDKLLNSVQVYGQHRAALFWAFVNSLIFYLLAVLNVYVTAMVFDPNISVMHMLVATPIIMLIMNIPFSIGNWGVMEIGYSGVFVMLGYSPALGLSVALLMRLKSFLDGAAGGALHPLFVTKKH